MTRQPIAREEIVFALAMAQKGVRCEMPPHVAEELCRVWLDWEGAPVHPVYEDDYAMGLRLLPAEDWPEGAMVRLVLEPEDERG